MALGKCKKKGDAVDGLKSALYSRTQHPDTDPAERTPLMPQDIHVPPAWHVAQPVVSAQAQTEFETQGELEAEPAKEDLLFMSLPKKKKISAATKFFIGSVVFFLAALGVAGYVLFFGGNSVSPQNIDMQIIAPSVIDGGKPTTFQILINNRNQVPLQLADLLLEYPQTTRDPNNQTQALLHERQSIGTIFSGAQLKRTASAIFYGSEGSAQKVTATLQYNIPGSNAIFTRQAELDFIVGSSPTSLSISMPNEAIAGQQFGSDILVTNNSTAPLADVVVEAQYPFGFSPKSATPTASAGNSFWRLGTLAPGDSKTIHLEGSIDGQDGDQRVFTFLVGSDNDATDTHVRTPFLSMPQTLTVHQSFIAAHIAINGVQAKTVSAPAGKAVNATIEWQNNLPETISNLQFVLSLSGPMLDTSSIQTSNGFYQSANGTITWSKDQDASLANVPPGASGSIPFTFTVLPPGQGGSVYTNPTIDLNLALSGLRQNNTGAPQTVSSAATAQINITSALAVAASALHFSGAFQNTGPMPPQAEQATSYTVVWTVSNSSNSIANAAVSATLPPYVTFLKAAGGISYNASSRTVTWNIGNLKAGVGYTAPALSGSFQVSLLPSASQVGQAPLLTGPVSLSGQDRFTQAAVSASANAPTTALASDSGYQASMGQVAPK